MIINFDTKTILQVIAKRIWYQTKMLPYRPRLWWDSLYPRQYEFHKSYDLDISAYEKMDKIERKQYLNDLNKRRQHCHRQHFNDEMAVMPNTEDEQFEFVGDTEFMESLENNEDLTEKFHEYQKRIFEEIDQLYKDDSYE